MLQADAHLRTCRRIRGPIADRSCVYSRSLLCVQPITSVCTADHFCVYSRSLLCVQPITSVCTADRFCVYSQSLLCVQPVTSVRSLDLFCVYSRSLLCVLSAYTCQLYCVCCRGSHPTSAGNTASTTSTSAGADAPLPGHNLLLLGPDFYLATRLLLKTRPV
jgi:hypothetical protein